MKKFEVYKDIRKRAIIMGLPITLFGLMMISVIGSLMLIIFSFSLVVIIIAMAFNTVLYLGFLYSVKKPHVLHFQKVFPTSITHKKSNDFSYEED